MVMFLSTFPHQIFSYFCFYRQDFIKTVRLLLAVVSINELNKIVRGLFNKFSERILISQC